MAPLAPTPRRTFLTYWSVALIYGLTLVALTLFKTKLSFGEIWTPGAHQQRSLDLELFDGFRTPSVWWAPWLNTLGNVALFVPFGVLVAARMKAMSGYREQERAPWWQAVGVAVALGALTSLFIETTQYMLAIGYTDVDDLAGNTLGSALGALGWMWLPGWRSRAVGLMGVLVCCVIALVGLGSSAFV